MLRRALYHDMISMCAWGKPGISSPPPPLHFQLKIKSVALVIELIIVSSLLNVKYINY